MKSIRALTLISLISVLFGVSLFSGPTSAQQTTSPEMWGLSSQEWRDLEGGPLREKIGLQNRQAEVEAAISRGDSMAMAIAAGAYASGYWGRVDPKRAMSLSRASAEMGDVRAIAVLTQLLISISDEKNDAPKVEARRWAQQGVDKDSALAMASLAFLLERGWGGPENKKEAIRLYRTAAERGVTSAMHSLGTALVNGSYVEKNEQEGSTWFRKAAENGYLPAVRDLAFALINGTWVQKNEAEGAAWAEKAALRGDGEAMRLLGVLTDRGVGVSKNEDAATEWFRKSAEAGNFTSMSEYALRLKDGTGVPKNPVEAVTWFRKAAESGNASSMTHLAVALLDGTGVPKNEIEGASWVSKAASLGDLNAMRLMGVLAERGVGMPKDNSMAAQWFRKAAEAGNVRSMVDLAVALLEGNGIPKNEVDGAYWAEKAATAGDARAMRIMGDLAKKSTSSLSANQATQWYCKSAEARDQIGMYYCADAMLHGKGISKNVANGAKWLRKAAEEGSVDSMLYLAKVLASDEGNTLISERTAAAWIIDAYSKGGEVEGHLMLYVVMKNRGTKGEFAEIVRILEGKCGRDDADSCAALASILDDYYSNIGRERDGFRSNALFQKSCHLGDGHSCWRYALDLNLTLVELEGRMGNDRTVYEYFQKSIALGGLNDFQLGVAKYNVAFFEVAGRMPRRRDLQETGNSPRREVKQDSIPYHRPESILNRVRPEPKRP